MYGNHEKTADKWLLRASAYETILVEHGVDEAQKYIDRYMHKIDRFLDACWRLYKRRLKESKKESHNEGG